MAIAMRQFALITCLICALGTLASAQTSSDGWAHMSGPAFAAMQKIDAERIRAHVRFLADDLLEGRGTGQRGGDIAAQYIASEFALYGLKPAGDNGTFMQKVPLVGITPEPETTFSFVPTNGSAMHLKALDQYVAYDQTQQAKSDVDAEIVY